MSTDRSPRKILAPHRSRQSIAHMLFQEVNTNKENVAINEAAAKAAVQKPRSKSIGPGGLDALKEDAGNRRQSSASYLVKSILKPTVRLSPPKQIPPQSRSTKSSPAKLISKTISENAQNLPSSDVSAGERPNSVGGSDGLFIPFTQPMESAGTQKSSASPSQKRTTVPIRTEEEQQTAAKERQLQEALAEGDARRKSLANRRVSFAPEATLHTWDVVEVPEDYTTSSGSTNSTRRASALSVMAISPHPWSNSLMLNFNTPEPPLTPPKQSEEVQVTATPSHQRDLHQKKRRRSSEASPMDFNNPDDISSSPYSRDSVGSDETGQQEIMSTNGDSQSSASDDGDFVEDESTVTGIDGDDTTMKSHGSSSTGSSSRLEEALRQAAKQAGTQGIDYDENGDISMEIADDEVTDAFKPWMKEERYASSNLANPRLIHRQENENPFSPAFKAGALENDALDELERTMEFTQAVGNILPKINQPQNLLSNSRRKSDVTATQSRSAGLRRYSGNESVFGDETMDLTTAIGAIQPDLQIAGRFSNGSSNEDEELSMEFTSAVGGLLEQVSHASRQNGVISERSIGSRQQLRQDSYPGRDESVLLQDGMDITLADGCILPAILERTEPLEDQIMEMDVTNSIGSILPPNLNADNRSEKKTFMKKEIDAENLLLLSAVDNAPVESTVLNHKATVASETGSPRLAASQRRNNSRKSLLSKSSPTLQVSSRQVTPVKKPSTPSKQLTPQLIHPTTPGKTPPLKNVAVRTASPKKLFETEIEQANPIPQSSALNPLFKLDAESGEVTSKIVLKPKRRRSSGLGIDKEGLGSPRVTALLEKRRSIGEEAKTFSPRDRPPRGVRFDNPQMMEEELDIQRAEDERRESGRGILQMEPDSQDLEEEKDATANLKEMIERLTPKKRPKARKSLHVGAAKGLLGKRPVELDEDDDEDLTPKQLLGREGSPIKRVRLTAPPSKVETIGRVTRSIHSLTEPIVNNDVGTPQTIASPTNKSLITTPIDRPRFKDAEHCSSGFKLPMSFEKKLGLENSTVDMREDDDRIHLQDFLNMTSIRFMELNTTKRRLTVVPSTKRKSNSQELHSEDNNSGIGRTLDLEKYVVAGACTIPMLELYQHSCRELKKYIAEGRNIVREIENDTFEENPPLFREYMSAPLELKSIMDNQFKNIKTHARLLSKAMWYEWRMKLLDGLKEGLLKVDEGMLKDEKALKEQEQLLEPVLPRLIQERERLQGDRQLLQAQADELVDCGKEELQGARDSLVAVNSELQAKLRMLEDLQNELREKEGRLEDAAERKQQFLDDIQKAERVRQEHRTWSSSEIAALQAKVNALENTHGWMITSAAKDSLTMAYRNALQLSFSPQSFNKVSGSSGLENSPIRLTYIADVHEYHPDPLTTEKRFFLQNLQAQVQCLVQFRTKIQDLLGLISGTWDQACKIAEEIRFLGRSYITEPVIISDEALRVTSVLLLRKTKTKIVAAFNLKAGVSNMNGAEKIDISIMADAKVAYGEGLKGGKMRDFLEERLSVGWGGKGGLRGKGERKMGTWVRAVEELEATLIARGRR